MQLYIVSNETSSECDFDVCSRQAWKTLEGISVEYQPAHLLTVIANKSEHVGGGADGGGGS